MEGSHLSIRNSMADTQPDGSAEAARKRDIWKFSPLPDPELASRHRTHGNLLEVLDEIRVSFSVNNSSSERPSLRSGYSTWGGTHPIEFREDHRPTGR